MIDIVLLDVGGTLVEAAPPATAVADLEVTLRPGVLDDLAHLAAEGVRMAAVTDTAVMDEATVRGLLEPTGVAEHLLHIVTSVDVGAAKPDPTGVLVALDRLGASTGHRVLMVGDDPVDAGAAAAAGIAYVDVEGGGVREAVHRWLRAQVGHGLDDALDAIRPPDEAAMLAAEERQGRLTKPPGSMGRLEELGNRLAGMAGRCPPPVPAPAAVAVFAADHGSVASGVSAWPREVTAQMVANLCNGGAAVNVLADRVGASVTVVDVGVATPIPVAEDHPTLWTRRVRRGTDDIATRAAMTVTEARCAIDVGTQVAHRLVGEGARCLLTGDMGIGNTTAAAALIARFTGVAAEAVTGRGAGADDEAMARKRKVVAEAAERSSALDNPVEVLAEIGGLEIAALAGFILGGAADQVPVLVDGVIALAALVVASELSSEVTGWVVAGHRSVEPGATAALEHLDLEPVLDLGLRLGEGTGAVLALPAMQASAALLSEMATFDGAGVSEGS